MNTHVDGSSNPRGAGADIVLEGPNDILIEKSLHFAFKTLNNQAEYEAILAGLSLARESRRQKINMQNRLQTHRRSSERRVPNQRPHPPTILPSSPRNHPIHL